MAANGRGGRGVADGAARRRPTSGCTGRRASTLLGFFQVGGAAPVNLALARFRRM